MACFDYRKLVQHHFDCRIVQKSALGLTISKPVVFQFSTEIMEWEQAKIFTDEVDLNSRVKL